MSEHSTNGHGGQTLRALEAQEVRRLFERLVSGLGSCWDYDRRGPSLRGCFRLGDGAVCNDRCLLELVGRTAPESGITPHLEVCDGKSVLNLGPELGEEGELSLTALRFALQWDGLHRHAAGEGGSIHAD